MPLIQHTLLKLYWANFTTTQVHQIIDFYPDFSLENEQTRMDIIKDWVLKQNSHALQRKLDQFKMLKTEYLYNYMKRIKLKYVTYYDKDYPLLLKEIYHFPYVIFIKEPNNCLINLIH